MEFGLEDRHWTLLKDLAINPLEKQGCKIYIFGSRARGDYKKFSDIDLLIEKRGEKPRLGDILESLEQSNLPIKVDLVLLRELATSYIDGVMKDRVQL